MEKIFWAEMIGTAILLLLGNGVVANVVLNNTKGNASGWIVITVGWAMAVFTAVLCVGEFSGAHINPAVTIGLAVAGAGDITWSMVPLYLSAQFLGGAIGGGLVWLMYKDHFSVTEDKEAKLAVFCTGPAISNTLSNLLSETIGTFVLVFAVLYMVNPTVGIGAISALPVALVVLGIGLCLGGTTGYAINPARDLSPRLMHALLPVSSKGGSNWGYSWIPVIGPILGAVLAALAFEGLSGTLIP